MQSPRWFKPRRALLIAGLWFAAFFWVRFTRYLDGRSFDTDAYLVIALGIAILSVWLLVLSVKALIAVTARKLHPKWLVYAAMPMLCFGVVKFNPIPTFLDGMAETATNEIGEQRLLAFAAEVRQLTAGEQCDACIVDPARLTPEHRRLTEFGKDGGRLTVKGGVVTLLWGGDPLPGFYWGIAITPVEEDNYTVPRAVQRRIFPRVWLYTHP